ncbi:MAG: L-histidine N(alpha)-methyltransferase [Actinomycetes bacterium]
MTSTTRGTRLERHLTDDDLVATLCSDVAAGLTARPPTLPPKYFYDARGSELFEQITRLPEYYPTRREAEVLAARADDIAGLTGASTVVELGSGSSTKTRLVLDALSRAGTLETYVPVDVSESALLGAAEALRPDYPALDVRPVVADLERHLHLLPRQGRRLAMFLGGTIGNLLPAERAAFLAGVHEWLAPGDHLLLGTDLVKDSARLVAAYDDEAGVTAEFNRNVLQVLRTTLDAQVDVDAFEHRAVWDADNEWIEMRLRAVRETAIDVPELGVRADFAAGDEMRTEVSAKFRRDRVAAELDAAGFALAAWWTDEAGDFAVSLARCA